MSTIVITGAASGIGLATRKLLEASGHRVIGVDLRDVEVVADLAVPAGRAAMVDGVSLACDGVLDGLVAAAGLFSTHPGEQVVSVNYFGAVAMMQAVLPGMRQRGSGNIVNISSGAGRYPVPNQAPYAASKHALEAASEALAHELAPFGVHVTLIEPGIVKTAVFENSADMTYWDKKSPYMQVMRRNGKVFAAGFREAAQPEMVADAILEAITTDDYRLRWAVGKDAVGFAATRPQEATEEMIAMGDDLTDEEYNKRFFQLYGIAL